MFPFDDVIMLLKSLTVTDQLGLELMIFYRRLVDAIWWRAIPTWFTWQRQAYGEDMVAYTGYRVGKEQLTHCTTPTMQMTYQFSLCFTNFFQLAHDILLHLFLFYGIGNRFII